MRGLSSQLLNDFSLNISNRVYRQVSTHLGSSCCKFQSDKELKVESESNPGFAYLMTFNLFCQ